MKAPCQFCQHRAVEFERWEIQDTPDGGAETLFAVYRCHHCDVESYVEASTRAKDAPTFEDPDAPLGWYDEY